MNKKIDDLRVKSEKIFVDDLVKLGEKKAPEAAIFWKLAATKFKEGIDFVKKNGYLVDKISDLKNRELENAVREKLASQHLKTELRGIVLNEDSDFAKKLSKSIILNNHIKKNVAELGLTDKLPNTSLAFELNDFSANNYLALHNVDIRDIHLDKQNNLRVTFLDSIDYNFGEPWLRIPREI